MGVLLRKLRPVTRCMAVVPSGQARKGSPMPYRVVILGCGPAGLAAAWAAVQSGREAAIVSNTYEPSRLYGCQYLHAPIPGFEHAPKTIVDYSLIGTPEQYRQKVYGDKWEGRVSPEDFVGAHEAWDIRYTYRKMWTHLIEAGTVAHYIGEVVNGVIPDLVYQLDPGRIISTIPAPALCFKPDHKFNYHSIYANGSRTAQPMSDNTIICDGTDRNAWYRISNVFGYRTTEWASKPEGPSACVPKPLDTDCDCYPEIHRVGRYGAWRKSYLVHEVYPEVTELLK